MVSFLQLEDGVSYLLQEDGTSKFILDTGVPPTTPTSVTPVQCRFAWLTGELQIQSIWTGIIYINLLEDPTGFTQITQQTLYAGTNLIIAPAGASFVVINPLNANAQVPITLQGAASDTGVLLSITAPTFLPITGNFILRLATTSDVRLLEDGTSVRLLEDGVSRRLLETST